jgi:glycosyltransferase involved in cell wall biosynthesis
MASQVAYRQPDSSSEPARVKFPWEEQLRTSGIDITLMVPCLNEEHNVGAALENIRGAMERAKLSYEVIVIDDGSTDGTSEAVRRYQAAHPNMPIYLHRNETNRGLARNFVDGAFMARGWYYRIVNGDAVEPPEVIANLLSHVGKADIIIPYMEQSKARTFGRRALSRVYTGVVNLCSGYKIQYYNGLAIYRTFDLLRMHTQSRGFGFQAETLTRMLDSGLSYEQVWSMSNERAEGKSKAITVHNWLSTAYALFRILMSRLRRRFYG